MLPFDRLHLAVLLTHISHARYLWVRWTLGRLGLGEVYDNIVLDLNAKYLEEVKQLQTDKIFTDSTYSFEDAKQAYERINTGRARGKVIVEVTK